MMRLWLKLVLLILSAAGLLAAATRLSAQQYRRAEDIYQKVIAQCCVRKSGALKLHTEIEQRIAAGETDETVLVDLSRRLGGGPRQFDEEPSALVPLVAIAGIAGLALATCFLTRWNRSVSGSGAGTSSEM